MLLATSSWKCTSVAVSVHLRVLSSAASAILWSEILMWTELLRDCTGNCATSGVLLPLVSSFCSVNFATRHHMFGCWRRGHHVVVVSRSPSAFTYRPTGCFSTEFGVLLQCAHGVLVALPQGILLGYKPNSHRRRHLVLLLLLLLGVIYWLLLLTWQPTRHVTWGMVRVFIVQFESFCFCRILVGAAPRHFAHVISSLVHCECWLHTWFVSNW